MSGEKPRNKYPNLMVLPPSLLPPLASIFLWSNPPQSQREGRRPSDFIYNGWPPGAQSTMEREESGAGRTNRKPPTQFQSLRLHGTMSLSAELWLRGRKTHASWTLELRKYSVSPLTTQTTKLEFSSTSCNSFPFISTLKRKKKKNGSHWNAALF